MCLRKEKREAFAFVRGKERRKETKKGRPVLTDIAGVPEMHAARGGGEEEATDDRGRAKSEAPDMGLALWQNEAHRTKRR